MLASYFRAVVFVLLSLWLLPACAAADDSGTDHGVVVEHLVRHYVVAADGSYRVSVEDVRTIVAADAIASHTRHAIALDPVRDAVVSVDAWTQKPDGRRLPVDVRQAAATPTVLFRGVAVGDRLVLRYVLQRRTARLSGHFDDLVLPQPLRHRDFQLIYDLPATLPLHADAVGFVPVAEGSPSGRRRYRWRYVDGANPRAEAGAVSQVDDGRRLAVSTFADYPALATAFRQALAAGSGPVPATLTQAAQATAALRDPRARALALSAWTARALPSGNATDRAVLLASALTATGIRATPALVNDANAYTLPDAPTLGVFNHILVFAPDLGIFLDPASATQSNALLPAALLGKPVLQLDTGRFAMTPLSQRASSAGTVADALAALTQEGNRTRSYTCPAIDAEDRTTLDALPGTRLPDPASVITGGIFYTANYQRADKAIIVKRRLSFRHGTPTCTPADFRAMQPALERIRRDLQRPVAASGRRT